MMRQARIEDAAAIVGFQCAMALETEALQLTRAVVVAGVDAVFKDPSKGTYWVYEQGGHPVACLLTIPEWSDWRNGTVLWIHSLYVVPAFRKRGIFRAMYSDLRSRVELDPKLRGLRLYVEQGNTRAHATYESLQMSREHYFLYEWLKG